MSIKKLINKAKTIGEAWKNVIITDEEFEPLYQDRLEVCNKCEHNVLSVCSLCGCPLASKTRSRYVDDDGEITECPIYKWKDTFHETENKELVVIRNLLPINLQKYFDSDRIPKEEWIEFLKEKQ